MKSALVLWAVLACACGGGAPARAAVVAVQAPASTSVQAPASTSVLEPTAVPPAAAQGESGWGDRDGDGIPDERDKCPDDPEDRDGYEDEDGCPDPDNDQDGILDVNDKCPNHPETYNGWQDEDGCPDKPPPGFKAPAPRKR